MELRSLRWVPQGVNDFILGVFKRLLMRERAVGRTPSYAYFQGPNAG
jgi:hypothetical protein